MDLRKPGEVEDDISELAEDGMEPEDCFPKRECEIRSELSVISLQKLLLHCRVKAVTLFDTSWFVLTSVPETL